jgi:hypothetical protein
MQCKQKVKVVSIQMDKTDTCKKYLEEREKEKQAGTCISCKGTKDF